MGAGLVLLTQFELEHTLNISLGFLNSLRFLEILFVFLFIL